MSMMLTGSLTLGSSKDTAVAGKDYSSFTKVSFQTPFPSGAKVVVVPAVQTFNGPETPGVRIAEVTNTGFMIRLNELVGRGAAALGDGHHTDETIGWVAFSV